jgi:hypothetical protein
MPIHYLSFLKMIPMYTQTTSKFGKLARRRPEFEPGLPAPKQLNLNKLSDAGGFKCSGSRRGQKPNFEVVCLYRLFLFFAFYFSASLFGQNDQSQVYIGGWLIPNSEFSAQGVLKTDQNHVDLMGWNVQEDGHIICAYPDMLPKQIAEINEAKKLRTNFKGSFVISGGLNYLLTGGIYEKLTFFVDLWKIVHDNQFDGVTLDWEWPLAGKEQETTAILSWIKWLFPQNFILSITVGYCPAANAGYNFSELDFVDYFEMMDYDINPTPNGICKTSVLSPLDSIKAGIEAYIALGIPPHKLISVFPLYGYAWNGVAPGPNLNGLGQIGNYCNSWRYYEVLKLADENPHYVFYQNDTDSWYYDPYTDAGTFIQFQSNQAIIQKTEVMSKLKIGGVSVFSQFYDTSAQEGLYTIASNFLEDMR